MSGANLLLIHIMSVIDPHQLDRLLSELSSEILRLHAENRRLVEEAMSQRAERACVLRCKTTAALLWGRIRARFG